MPRLSPKTAFFVVALAITLPLDLWSKRWILDRFAYGEVEVIIPGFFNLTHVRNPGGAFSLLADLPPLWSKVFFLGTGALAIVLLMIFLIRLGPRERLSAVAIGAVLGGAIGNLSDRVIYGEVIDFLDFRLWGGYVWPTFNLADVWIVCGVAILMLEMFFEPEREPEPCDETGVDAREAAEEASAGARACERNPT